MYVWVGACVCGCVWGLQWDIPSDRQGAFSMTNRTTWLTSSLHSVLISRVNSCELYTLGALCFASFKTNTHRRTLILSLLYRMHTHAYLCRVYTYIITHLDHWIGLRLDLLVGGSCRETFTLLMDVSDNPFVIISFEAYVIDSIIKGTLCHFSPLSPD